MTADTEHLDQPVPPEKIKQVPGTGNRKYPYIELPYALDELDKIVGPFRWSAEIVSKEILQQGVVKAINKDSRKEIQQFVVVACAHCRISTISGDVKTTYEDVGVCDGISNNVGYNPSDAYTTALKGAVTDGFKRALRLIGDKLGRNLTEDNKASSNRRDDSRPRDRWQPNDQTDPKHTPPKPTAPNTAAQKPNAPTERPRAIAPQVPPSAPPPTEAPACAAPSEPIAPPPMESPLPPAAPIQNANALAPDLAPNLNLNSAGSDTSALDKPTATLNELLKSLNTKPPAEITTTDWIAVMTAACAIVKVCKSSQDIEIVKKKRAEIDNFVDKIKARAQFADLGKWLGEVDNRIANRLGFITADANA